MDLKKFSASIIVNVRRVKLKNMIKFTDETIALNRYKRKLSKISLISDDRS